MKKSMLALIGLSLGMSLAQAQDTKVAIGMSGWTGFAPLTLAKEAGLFKKHGLDVDIKKIPQKDRHLALASGAHEYRFIVDGAWLPDPHNTETVANEFGGANSRVVVR